MRIFLFLICLAVHAEPEIRIAIGSAESKIVLHANELVATWDKAKTRVFSRELTLRANSSGIVVDGSSTGAQIIKITAAGLISVEGKQFRGVLEVNWVSEKGEPKLRAIHPVPMETYVVGIISSEVPKAWPLESLKVQAIAARTYAVWQKFRRLDKMYHMESSVLDQVYGGVQREHSLAQQAAEATFGQVLTYDAKPIQAYFHSTCGGHTEDSREWIGVDLPYLRGVKCGYCNQAPTATWVYKVSLSDLNKALKSVFDAKITNIKIASYTPMGRARTIELSAGRREKIIPATVFREKVGYFNLRSTWIDSISIHRHEVVFKGRGFGHGVGMCQFGAMGMAKAGMSFDKILLHYYPGAELRRMY